jgi:RNA polymerase sigma-B factor
MNEDRIELKAKLKEFASTHDRALRDELVERHLGLARHLAKRFVQRGEPYEDLVQVASIALIKAVDRFDPEIGVEFATYATKTILGELKRHFRDKGWAMRPPRRIQELYLELSQAVESLSQRLHRSPTIKELMEETDSSEEEVLEAIEAGQSYRTSSLDASGPEDDNLETKLGVESEDFEVAELRTALLPHLLPLSERDRSVLVLRFVHGLTQSEIAKQLGVSQMQVSRLLSKSLNTLRESMDRQ